jgi:hypothetical protein
MGPSTLEYEVPDPVSEIVVGPPSLDGALAKPGKGGSTIDCGELETWEVTDVGTCATSFGAPRTAVAITFCLFTEHNWLWTSFILSRVLGLLCTSLDPQYSQINSRTTDIKN